MIATTETMAATTSGAMTTNGLVKAGRVRAVKGINIPVDALMMIVSGASVTTPAVDHLRIAKTAIPKPANTIEVAWINGLF